MRLRNDGQERALFPLKEWRHRERKYGNITLNLVIEPGELSDYDLEDLVQDPNDPKVHELLKSLNLSVVELPTRFERINAP